MGRIILVDTGQEFELKDGELIRDKCEEILKMTFCCKEGVCGTCRTIVAEGMENLTEKTQAELEMPLQEGDRLACQCKIKEGIVKLKNPY